MALFLDVPAAEIFESKGFILLSGTSKSSNTHASLKMFGVFSSLFSLPAQKDKSKLHVLPFCLCSLKMLMTASCSSFLFFQLKYLIKKDSTYFLDLWNLQEHSKMSDVWRLLFCSLYRLKVFRERPMVCSSASAAQIFEQKRMWAKKHV